MGLKEKFGVRSYDIIGDVAIIFIPPELWERRFEIGKELMKIHRRLKAVYAEAGKTEGSFRLKPLELIAGIDEPETLHKEHGLRFKLDVKRVYFSPRQSSERLRLAKLVEPGSVVCVFFAGIGPIPVYLAKFADPKKIYAIEINPVAYMYMLENLALNKIKNVVPILGDVREKYKLIPEPCDLVIMPLPIGSLLFLEEAKAVLKKDGRAVIYVGCYEGELEDKLKEIEKAGFEVLDVRREKEIGPRKYRFVVLAKPG